MPRKRKRQGTAKKRKAALRVLVKAKRKFGKVKIMQKRLTQFRKGAKRSLDQAKNDFRKLA